MNLLASAIPGVRNIRAPLVAGYIWLLCAWLIVRPETPLTEHLPKGPAGSVVELADTAGPVATAAGVSVVAYLVGAVSVAIPRAVMALERWFLSPLVSGFELAGFEIDFDERSSTVASALEDDQHSRMSSQRSSGRVRRRLFRWLSRMVPGAPRYRGIKLEFTPNVDQLLSGDAETVQVEDGRGDVERPGAEVWERALSRLADRVPVRPPALEDALDVLRDRGPQLAQDQMRSVLKRMLELPQQMSRELDLPSTLLVGDQPEVYAEADRVRAEAEFRLAVVAPLSALTIVLTVDGGWWWLFGATAPFALLLAGLAQRREAQAFLMNSIESGKTPSPTIRRFREFVDKQRAQAPGSVDV